MIDVPAPFRIVIEEPGKQSSISLEQRRTPDGILAIGAALDAPHNALRLMLLGALNWAKTWYRPGAKKPAEIVDGMINILESPLRAEETTP